MSDERYCLYCDVTVPYEDLTGGARRKVCGWQTWPMPKEDEMPPQVPHEWVTAPGYRS